MQKGCAGGCSVGVPRRLWVVPWRRVKKYGEARSDESS